MRPGLNPVSRDVRAKVPQPHRELLHRYAAVLSAKRRKQGLSPVSPAEVAGAMICFILDHHQQSILDGYEALRTSTFLQKFESFLGGDGSPSPDGTGTAEVPDVRGASGA